MFIKRGSDSDENYTILNVITPEEIEKITNNKEIEEYVDPDLLELPSEAEDE